MNFGRFLFSHVNFTTFHMPGEDLNQHDDLELTLVKDAVRVLQMASAGCPENCETRPDNTLKDALIKVSDELITIVFIIIVTIGKSWFMTLHNNHSANNITIICNTAEKAKLNEQ